MENSQKDGNTRPPQLPPEKPVCKSVWETWVQSWVGKVARRREWIPTPVFFPGAFHGQRTLTGYSPWGCPRVGQDGVTNNNNNKITSGILVKFWLEQ